MNARFASRPIYTHLWVWVRQKTPAVVYMPRARRAIRKPSESAVGSGWLRLKYGKSTTRCRILLNLAYGGISLGYILEKPASDTHSANAAVVETTLRL